MFKIGQKVVCIHQGGWYTEKKILWFFNKKTPTFGPKKDEIIKITGVEDNGCLYLKGYEDYGVYVPRCFRPLDETFTEETCAWLNEHFESLKVTL